MNNPLSIEEFHEQLVKMKGNEVKIVKKELEDIDEITIKVDDLLYYKNEKRLDDYTPKYVLQFKGEGSIKTAENEPMPLPDEDYEIPLDDETNYQFDNELFMIKTDRAHYQIEPLH